MKTTGKMADRLVLLLALGTVLPLLLIRTADIQGAIFGTYTLCMTVLLLLMYSRTSTYQPQPDTGFRPKISVVIPAKNEAGVIQQVVKAVFDSDYPSSRLEIIAVDDGSTDETRDRLQALKRQPRLSSRLVIIRHEQNYGKRVALASAVEPPAKLSSA